MRYFVLFVCYFLYMKEGITHYVAVELVFVFVVVTDQTLVLISFLIDQTLA